MVSLSKGILISRVPAGNSTLAVAGLATVVDLFSATSSLVAWGVASLAALRADSNSSPAFPITAKTPSTFTALPFSTPMYNKTPSLKLSSSMVALSVSTSANKSPDFTLSPTFLCHSTITPSVIVSLIRGMRITSAIFFIVLYWKPKLMQKWELYAL